MPRTKSLRAVVLILLIVLTASAADGPRTAGVPEIFSPEGSSSARAARTKLFGPRRVLLKTGALVRREGEPAPLVRWNLGEGLSCLGKVESTQSDGLLQFVSRGRLTGGHSGEFIVVVNGTTAAGLISVEPSRRFEIVYSGTGEVHLLREVDGRRLDSCGCNAAHAVFAETEPDSKIAPVAAMDDGSQIDLLIVYTPQARVAAGGTTAMQNLVQLSVEAANQAYETSGVTVRLRLVHQREVSYTETGLGSTDLNRLRNVGDNFLDEVHALRDQYGADLVSLFVSNLDSCGIAFVMGTETLAFAEFGFSVVENSCAAANFSFAHEVGHNLGLNHATGDTPVVFPYGVGYQFQANGGLTYRTIMAVGNGTRLQRFSNPDQTFGGVPVGRPINGSQPSHEVLAINQTADTVANFRQDAGTEPPEPPDCPHDLDGNGTVTFGDLIRVLFGLGPCNNCSEDVDDNGTVNFRDLLAVLQNLGPCPNARTTSDPGRLRPVPDPLPSRR